MPLRVRAPVYSNYDRGASGGGRRAAGGAAPDVCGEREEREVRTGSEYVQPVHAWSRFRHE